MGKATPMFPEYTRQYQRRDNCTQPGNEDCNHPGDGVISIDLKLLREVVHLKACNQPEPIQDTRNATQVATLKFVRKAKQGRRQIEKCKKNIILEIKKKESVTETRTKEDGWNT